MMTCLTPNFFTGIFEALDHGFHELVILEDDTGNNDVFGFHGGFEDNGSDPPAAAGAAGAAGSAGLAGSAGAAGAGVAAGAQALKIMAAINNTPKMDNNRFVFIGISSPSITEVLKFAIQQVGILLNFLRY